MREGATLLTATNCGWEEMWVAQLPTHAKWVPKFEPHYWVDRGRESNPSYDKQLTGLAKPAKEIAYVLWNGM